MEKEITIQPSIYVQYEPEKCTYRDQSDKIIEKRRSEGQAVHCLDQPDWSAMGITASTELIHALEGYCYSTNTHGYLSSFGGMPQRQTAAEFCSCPSYLVPKEDVYLIYSSYKGFNTTLMTMCDGGDSILVPQVSSDELHNFMGMLNIHGQPYKIKGDGSVDMESVKTLVESVEKPPKVMLVHYHHSVLGKEIRNHKEVIDFCAEKRILVVFECSYALTKQNESDWKKIIEDASPIFPLLILYDLSKEHGHNGTIVGFAALIDKPRITAPFKNCFENVLQVTLFPCSLATYLVDDVLKRDCNKSWRNSMKEHLRKNAKVVYDGLNEVEAFHVSLPDDGYVIYAEIDQKLGTSEEICLKLLEKTGFCLSPTSRYGDPENAISFYLAADTEVYVQLVNALKLIVGDAHKI